MSLQGAAQKLAVEPLSRLAVGDGAQIVQPLHRTASAPIQDLLRNIDKVEQPVFGKHDHPLDRVFEFPDVPGPRVLNEALSRSFTDPVDPFGVLVEEMIDQMCDVLTTFSQGGHIDGDHVKMAV